ncbi:aminotransferase class V-fold PLP-dependent enzyme [Mycoplasma sp. Pen4]|uniref:aminotransferase class V-fold PLP-dependent enzyme n=1 Tax=Mycoplasma sp. Pen4 TaxID=640330 RepID=UPI0016540B01|nr:aminotransferase class V-fold PLP-dependent enzyme [Mycoplasma sp. Pen4]QNM93902.1 aminotransferase class V-fold PLP-dependent enzyme [Mycoplasma sp. Pen4]
MEKSIKQQFPILQNITYFDSAALVLKPQSAIDAVTDFYTYKSISSRTADTPLGNHINQTIKQLRHKVAHLIDAQDNEIIFTSGTTESLNIFAEMAKQILKPGDVILLSAHNHSSNIIPWMEIVEATKSELVISLDIMQDIKPGVKIVSLSHETNNFNQSFDIKAIAQKAHEVGAILVDDAAQAIAHQKVSLKQADVIVFSTNKFYGPTGLGVLAVKESILKDIKPVRFGGGSVSAINTDNTWSPRNNIGIHEPGTPNLAGIYMFNASLDFFNQIGYEKTQEILDDLSNYLHAKLSELDNIEVSSKAGDYIALINVKGINAQDVATYLGSKNIYTIAGIFCAPYLRNIQPHHSFLRISLGIYNTYEDIDKLVKELKEGGDFYAF